MQLVGAEGVVIWSLHRSWKRVSLALRGTPRVRLFYVLHHSARCLILYLNALPPLAHIRIQPITRGVCDTASQSVHAICCMQHARSMQARCWLLRELISSTRTTHTYACQHVCERDARHESSAARPGVVSLSACVSVTPGHRIDL